MKKNHKVLSLFVLIPFLLTLFSYVYAQPAEPWAEPGKAILETRYGSVTIYLPSQLFAGEIISGTVSVTPNGASKKQIEKNAEILDAYKISHGGTDFLIGQQQFSWQLLPGNQAVFSFKDEKGVEIANKVFDLLTPSEIQPPIPAVIQPYIVAGIPARVQGHFNGSLINSRVVVKEEARILAESQHELFFETPDVTGPQTVEITENGTTTPLQTNILNLDLGADKLNLLKGESTNIHITVSGLEGLKMKVPLSITNESKGNITLSGGEQQRIFIDPEELADRGVYHTTIKATAAVRGDFTVSVSVDPPGENQKSDEKAVVCECRINGRSYLLSPETCRKLGGENIDDNPLSIPLFDEEFTMPETKPFIHLGETQPRVPGTQVSPAFSLSSTQELAAVNYAYKNVLDTAWTSLPVTGGQGNVQFPENILKEGFYVIKGSVANKNNVPAEAFSYFEVSFSSGAQHDNFAFSVSENDIERERSRARGASDQRHDKEDELDSLYPQKADAEAKRDRDAKLAGELEKIDKTLDKVPGAYIPGIDDLLDSLRNLHRKLPGTTDTTLLNKAVDDALARLKACQDRLQKLKDEQQALEQERDKLKQQQDDALAELDQLFRDHGWTGRYGYHPDGRHWYGYVGDENTDTDLGDRGAELTRNLRALKKSYKNTLARLNSIATEIAAAQAECDQLAEALKKAVEAKQNGDELAAAQLALDNLCREIRSLLYPLLQWCRNNPDECDFEAEIIRMMKDCPTDSTEWKRFWQNFDHLLNVKKQTENELRQSEENQQDAVEALEGKIAATEAEIARLAELERRHYAEAERLRRQRAKELADAQREREERARQALEKKKVKAQPYLPEPVDPNDDMLKFHAQSVFKRLYLDFLIAHGPCDCKTMAVALANNTNTIMSDLIGRLGVAVFFAPMEAFPGVSLGGRLAIGVVKAIASSIYGGQKLSDELIKNLFDVIGGEMFPKLVGNDFTGNRINDLAGKGIEEILEAEGVRSIQWEGKTTLRECGEVSGTVTMMINPNTGWVVIMIKIPNCPLIVIKYKVNDDGVAISDPIVRVVK